MSELHVFWNDYDWVVAESVEDARLVYAEFCGHDTPDEEDEAVEWDQMPDDANLTIRMDEPGEIRVTQTNREWAEQKGRGFLCSTEY